MKKLIICLALATVAVSCKKIQAGGNKGTLKLKEGVERYSDGERTSGHEEDLAVEHGGEAVHGAHEATKTDSAAAKHADSAKTEH